MPSISAKNTIPQPAGSIPLMVTIDPLLPHPFPSPIAKNMVKSRKRKRSKLKGPITKIQEVCPLKHDVDYMCGWFAITREAGSIKIFTGPIDEDQVD